MKALVFVLLVAIAGMLTAAVSAYPSFVISGDSFMLDGKPVQIVSGSIHYFR